MVNYITGRWATKYKYLPTDIRFEGSCEERIQHLKARGYGLYSNIGKQQGIVYWQENCQRLKDEKRLADIETERLRVINEEKRIAESKRLEIKRLADIETERLRVIEAEKENQRMAIVNRDLNTEFRLSQLNLISQKEDLDSFYEIDKSSKVESIPSINDIDSIKKETPLETTAPIFLILGVGLVSYYLLKGNKK